MKTKGFVSAVSALMLLSPFASAGDPVQMWKCNINGDVSEESVIDQAGKWKKAASKLPGGGDMDVHVLFPVAELKMFRVKAGKWDLLRDNLFM